MHLWFSRLSKITSTNSEAGEGGIALPVAFFISAEKKYKT
jgi:hypothetical protein